MTSLKVFLDHASQPSRAVLVFCKINKIPFELVETKIVKMEHRAPEYAKINPSKKVPAILHGDFSLFESTAIMRYLAKEYNVPEQWYPRQDNKKAALIDEYIDWHHGNTRRCANLFFWSRLAPAVGMPIPKSFNLEQAKKEVTVVLKFMESYFLAKTPYILSEAPSIADMSSYQEITQLRMMEYDFSPYPLLQKWFKRIESIPQVAQQNVIFDKFVSSFAKKFPLPKL